MLEDVSRASTRMNPNSPWAVKHVLSGALVRNKRKKCAVSTAAAQICTQPCQESARKFKAKPSLDYAGICRVQDVAVAGEPGRGIRLT